MLSKLQAIWIFWNCSSQRHQWWVVTEHNRHFSALTISSGPGRPEPPPVLRSGQGSQRPLLVFLLTLAGLVYLLCRLLCLCSWLTGQGTSGGSESPSLLAMEHSPLDFSFHGFNEYLGPTTCRSVFPARPLLIPVLCIQYLPSIFNIPPACLQIYAQFSP